MNNPSLDLLETVEKWVYRQKEKITNLKRTNATKSSQGNWCSHCQSLIMLQLS